MNKVTNLRLSDVILEDVVKCKGRGERTPGPTTPSIEVLDAVISYPIRTS